jgi:hypothetical protein
MGSGGWKQIVLTQRCPYCVEGLAFRPMVEVSGRKDGLFFCSRCHHMAGSAETNLKCGCANCRNLKRDSDQNEVV